MNASTIKGIVFDCFGVFYLDSHDKLVERFPDQQMVLSDLRHQNDYGLFERADYLRTIATVTGADEQ